MSELAGHEEWKQLSRQECMTSIWLAQGKHCPVCGEKMSPVTRKHRINFWTIEHVFPRRRYKHLNGNTLVSHNLCNNEKGDRDPTGCELIILHLANARLGRELCARPALDYRDEVSAPSALQLAFAKAGLST